MLRGSGRDITGVDGNDLDRVFQIFGTGLGKTDIANVEVRYGAATVPGDEGGGGILNDGTLSLRGCARSVLGQG